VAQAAKDRAVQTLSRGKLNFSKMAELIGQRRLLLSPRILVNIKRMDQPGMLGDAAFRNTGSALRRGGQSFGQIAEAIERSGGLVPGHEDPVQQSERLHERASESGEPAWRRALALVRKIVFFPLRRRMMSLAIALIAILLLYALQGFLAIGQKVSRYPDNIAAVRRSTDEAMSSVRSFANKQIFRQSKEAPPPPPAQIAPPATAAPSPPSAASATASARPATAPTPPANASAPPAPPSAVPAGPPVSTPRPDQPASKWAANCGTGWEDRYSCSRRSTPFEHDRPRAFEDMTAQKMRRHSRMAGPCIRGVGGCYWGGGQY